jgi:hypothetical protein
MKGPPGGFVLVTVMFLLSSGCGGSGDNLPREPVSGNIRFGGEPLDHGTILLLPVNTATGIPSGGMIRDGSFSIARGIGPVPGDYKVVISSPTPKRPPPSSVEAVRDMTASEEERIPSQYNSATELTAKVEKGASNHFGFELAATGPPGQRRPGQSRSRR